MGHKAKSSPDLRPPTDLKRNDRSIRYATAADVPFIYDLANKYTNMIGYCPRGGIDDRVHSRRVILLEQNGQHAGYVSATHRLDGITHLPQVAVARELWRTDAGSDLLRTLVNAASDAGSLAITLRSAVDLDANRFWPTLGFELLGTFPGRRRDLNAWALRIRPDPQQDLPFSDVRASSLVIPLPRPNKLSIART